MILSGKKSLDISSLDIAIIIIIIITVISAVLVFFRSCQRCDEYFVDRYNECLLRQKQTLLDSYVCEIMFCCVSNWVYNIDVACPIYKLIVCRDV